MTHTKVDQLHPRIPLVNDDGTPTQYFMRWLQATWEKVGGTDDFIVNQQIRELYSSKDIDAIGGSKFTFISTAVDYTTSGNEFITVTSNVTITLNPDPDEGEEVEIVRNTTAGNVTITASRNISGDTSYLMLANYEGLSITYSVIEDEWFIG